MARVRGVSVGLGAVAMCKDLGKTMSLEVNTDSSAAKGVAQRRGVGRIRHLHTPLLWVQHRLQQKQFKLFKIDGERNRSDIGTKYLSAQKMWDMLARLGFKKSAGQSNLALRAAI